MLAFRRLIVLNAIDPGALRGDLGERLVLVDLEPITGGARRTDTELKERYRDAHPRLLGALRDLVVEVLAALPDVQVAELPRMADLGRVLAALDAVRPGLGAFPRFMAHRKRIPDEVLEADPVAVAVLRVLERHGEWQGTAKALLSEITPETERLPRGWPGTPHALAARLRRLATAFAEMGITVTRPERAPGGNRDRVFTIRRSGRARLSRMSRPARWSTRFRVLRLQAARMRGIAPG